MLECLGDKLEQPMGGQELSGCRKSLRLQARMSPESRQERLPRVLRDQAQSFPNADQAETDLATGMRKGKGEESPKD